MRSAFFVVAIVAIIGCAPKEAPTSEAAASVQAPAAGVASAEPPHHHANLAPTQGNKAAGTVEFIAHGDAVQVTGTITGLEPNSEHGFHIHEKGDCSAPDASSAGGHFNPTSQAHGNPDTPPHHAGDAHNLRADAQGTVQVNEMLPGVTLSDSGPNDILGKAVVLHAKADDYKSQPAGNSGARIACGVIE
jgi:superoxide dismutase, Cu-Zn family